LEDKVRKFKVILQFSQIDRAYPISNHSPANSYPI